MRTVYTAVVRRANDWWAIRIAELPGVFSQARRLDQVEAMARQATALFLDGAPDSFDLTVTEQLPDEAESALQIARQARRQAVEQQQAAAAATRTAVRELGRLGLPQRDIARLLDLSHQRVAQLAVEA